MNRHRGILRELQRRECNKECADCTSKGPLWASANLGVFLCIRCAGIHRKLGTHISFVRSVNLDSWKDKHIRVMKRVGNKVAKEYYEYHKPAHIKKLNEYSSPDTVEEYIRAKYERRVWVKKAEDNENDDEGTDDDENDNQSCNDAEVENNRVENEKSSEKVENNSPLLSFDVPQRDQLTPNTFVQQLFTKVEENRNKPHVPSSQTSSGYLSNLLGGREQPKKNTPQVQQRNGDDFFIGLNQGKSSKVTPGGNGNGNGDSLVHFLGSNPMTETKKDRIMKMFDGPKPVPQAQLRTQQQQQPRKKADPNQPSFMKWFDQPTQPQRTVYPNQGYYNHNHYRRNNNHHVRRSPQNTTTFNYVPKGRSVPLNYRGNSSTTSYPNFRKNHNHTKSPKTINADSFFN